MDRRASASRFEGRLMVQKMTRTELIIQLLKVAIGLAFGAYFVWWSLEVLDRLTPEDEVSAAVTDARLEPIHEAAIAAFARSWRRK
jgi:hypothetical protein